MSNMSYCRFQNTRSDLADCRDALADLGDGVSKLSEDELEAAESLVATCGKIVLMVCEHAGIDPTETLESPDARKKFAAALRAMHADLCEEG